MCDGISVAFFLDNWDLLKVVPERVFKELFERYFELFYIANFCVPYLKKGKCNEVKDFRPISLFTSVYKILAEVLANCLR